MQNDHFDKDILPVFGRHDNTSSYTFFLSEDLRKGAG
jgi:hypothetical protein